MSRTEVAKNRAPRRRKWTTRRRNALLIALIERDGARCRYCGEDAPFVWGEDARYTPALQCHSQRFIGIDHIIPATKGGSDDPSNCVICCGSCNSRKGTGPALDMLPPAPDRLTFIPNGALSA